MDKRSEEGILEHPYSATARVITDQGFQLLFTLRDTSASGLIAKLEEFQKVILSKGWRPEQSSKRFDQPSSQNTETVEVVCPICGAPAVKKTGTRKDGTKWEGIFCSTGNDAHKVWLQ